MDLLQLVILSLATSAISVTIAHSKFFEGLRNWMALRSDWLGELVECHYCLSHWVSLVFVLFYHPELIFSGVSGLVNLVVACFVIVALSSMSSRVILGE